MIKNILVPLGGSGSDAPVFQSAVALGRLFGAHLNFFHVRISGSEASLTKPHAAFAMGAGLRHLLNDLQAEGEDRAASARLHFEAFCSKEAIALVGRPQAFAGVSASWTEDDGGAAERLLHRSRTHDLVIVSRPDEPDGVRADVASYLALNSGRPVLVLPTRTTLPPLETVMICWKDTAECARAVAAAIPFLCAAKRVVIVTVQEPGFDEDAFADFVSQLGWRGIDPDVISLPDAKGKTAQALFETARRVGAALMVMGLYSRTPAREIIFGGVSNVALANAPVALLMMH